MSPKLFNILLVLTLLVLYFGFLQPMYTGNPGIIWTPENSIPSLKSQNVLYSNTLNQVELVRTSIEKINTDYKNISPELRSKVTVMLPDTIDPIRLRNEVTTIADKAGLALTGLNVTTDPKNTSKETNSFIVSFSFKGRYPVFKKLMEAFERNLRFYTVESVIIQRQDKKDDSITDPAALADDAEKLFISVVFKVYYLK